MKQKKVGYIRILIRFIVVIFTVTKHLRLYKKFTKLTNEKKKNSKYPKILVIRLINLGPTFVKIGQILSTRPDYLPQEYIEELKVLHNQVPPFSYDEVKSIINQELFDINEVFKKIEVLPVAAASLSQVHFGTLLNGKEVAVKVQRPKIQMVISTDLFVLKLLVNIVSLFMPRLSRNLNLKTAFNKFKDYTLKELDFSIEANTLKKFKENFKDFNDVKFPDVYDQYTTDKILVMERVDGLHLSEINNKFSRSKKEKLSKRLTEIEMKMFISDAFFHADLHPGNIFFKEDGSIIIIDVGMFGSLTDVERDRFLLYWLAIVEEEVDRAFFHLLKLGNATKNANKEVFFKEFKRVLDIFYASDISSRSLTKTYLEIFFIGAKYGYKFPSELMLQAKAMTTAEALVMTLTPQFKFNEEVKPIVFKELGSRANLSELRRRLKQSLPEWLLFGESINSDLIFSEKNKSELVWKELGKNWCQKLDEKRNEEVIHGEYEVIVDERLDKVFNFVTRFAQYPFWHPTYTDESRVIHISGKYVFLTPEIVGSVFRLDEIVDGNHLLSNAEITEFNRNKSFKWRAPLSMFPAMDIGTNFIFEDLGNNQTKLYEYFYYIDNPMADFFIHRRWFTATALTNHIKEELTGVKMIMEANEYQKDDVEFLWDNIDKKKRVLYNHEMEKPIRQK